ncbi:MAG: enoyl-CoA hydratase/isomerase family protein [Chromatiaceae bacterium]|nr:enoyl-CoA hydratase/isomerase family protein [Chromatiaceae bacterium]MCP5311948.1 enoyl-CoA hydratase/isomerase family protein [Chromatiaceae bacterium]
MNRHFRIDQDAHGIAWLMFDNADGGTNVLTEEVLEGLDQCLVQVAQMHPKGLVIASAKTSGFIAGADVKAFARVPGVASAEQHIRRVHEILHRLESMAFPTVAAIHGFCLGGGLELALACDYRVCCDDAGTRLGFPEVRLGIFPGYGGTVRSTRLLGDIAALGLMLGGHTVSGRAARRMGLVDLAVPRRELRAAATDQVLRSRRPRRAGWIKRLPAFAPLRPLVAQLLARQVAKRVRRDHYPAPFELLAHWRHSAGDPAAMYASEARNVARLINASSAQNLIRVFMLQDRLKAEGNKADFTPRHVHVVGGGVMGGDIAAWCALRGLRVTLQDRAPEFLTRAVQRAHALFKHKLKDPYAVQAAIDRLMPDHHGSGVRSADVVIEAIFEDIDAKRALYAQLEPQMKPDAVLATNTSSIPLAVLGERLQQPQRLVGLHFFNPVAKMPLLEIVHDTHTDAAMLARAAAFARHIDKLPLKVRSSPGFLVNRVLMPYLLEAVELLDEGVPAAVIDRAAVAFGMPMGPIELADTVGLDICLSVAQKMAQALHNPVPDRLRDLVEAQHLGRKSGRGFYVWKNDKPVKPETGGTPTLSDSDVSDRLVLRLVNESVACLREGVVADEDLLDAGVIFGTGFAPFRGGPMHYVHARGSGVVQQRLDEFEGRFGEHFHADAGWGAIA